MSNDIEISDEELKALTSAIKKRYDIDFTNYEVKSLKRGFKRLIIKHKLGSILGLWTKVLRDQEYFKSCIDDLTVNLTELFRNPEIWKKMHDDVLLQYQDNQQIKVWHAGCSTGEEVYTMAIVMNDKKLLKKTQVLATDLSSRALASAIEGEYSDILVKRYADSFAKYLDGSDINTCFEESEKGWRVKDMLRKHIEFKQHNLVQDGMNKKFDMIFCRNVMIYFDENLKNKVLKLFHEALAPGGYLIIGYYDMITEESKKIFELYDSTTRIYKKVD